MAHPKDNELIPIGTTVTWTKPRSKEKVTAIIINHCFQFQGRGFLNYEVELPGIRGRFAAYHDDIKLEALPTKGFPRREAIPCPLCGKPFYGVKCFTCGYMENIE